MDPWVQHILVLWATLYVIWGRGGRVDWREYRLTLAVTVAWAVSICALNSWSGTNDGFLNGKPTNPWILDLLGPWYLPVELVVVTVVWALMIWPWTRRRSAVETVSNHTRS